MKRIPALALCFVALSMHGLVQAQSDFHLIALRTRPITPAGQEFLCVGPYSVPECNTQIALLQAVLRRYDSEKLGRWTWVLVRSEDWKQIVSLIHLDPASPAFSHLERRQTFFDEALLALRPKLELELVTKWNIPFDQFLDFAVSHELGHAFCNESDEIKAELFGRRLRKRLPNMCATKKQHNLLAEIR
jgi:hypothetical protein